MTPRLAVATLLDDHSLHLRCPACAGRRQGKGRGGHPGARGPVRRDPHNAHDAKAFAALFAADGEFTNVIGMTARGREAIEAFHRPLFVGDTSKGNPSFKEAVLKVDEVRVRFLRPDVASVDILWTQTGSKAPDGKDRGTRKGLASWVVTKDDGAWRVAVMHNMDLLPVAR